MPPDPFDDPASRWERLRAAVGPDGERGGEPGPRHAIPVPLGGTVRALVVVVVAAVGLAGVLFWQARPRTLPIDPSLSAPESLGSSASTDPALGSTPAVLEVVVHVVGRVRRPGVVRLRPGARVADAVAAAGGLRAGTDPAQVNLARLVTDGEPVVVAPAGQAPTSAAHSSDGAPAAHSSDGSPAAPSRADPRLDLNLATAQELEALDGIGPVLAQRIVDFRRENGRFASVDDLREVSGIGPKIFAALQDQVTA